MPARDAFAANPTLTRLQDGKADVIANEDGDRQIPSVLSYVEGEELHGGQAKSQLVRNSKNTVAYFRDFLGQEYVKYLLRASYTT
jgi:molecular chaperone DnaK (HSP70)